MEELVGAFQVLLVCYLDYHSLSQFPIAQGVYPSTSRNYWTPRKTKLGGCLRDSKHQKR